MKRALALAGFVLVLANDAAAAPVAPLPMLPSVPRVSVTMAKDNLVVIEEVNLPRGEWRGEPLDLYVAFGAPGAPRAIDAHLVAVADGALEPDENDAGEAVATDRAPRRPSSAHPLLGRESMAGVVVHLSAAALTKAFAPGKMAALRMRTVLDVPEEDPSGARSVLVRLGASNGAPLTLGRVAVAVASARGKSVVRAEARLCGPDADTHLLAITPRAPSPPEPPVAPVLAVRHASDDLCVRLWSP